MGSRINNQTNINKQMEETIQKIHTLTYLLEKNHDQNGTPTNNRFGLSPEDEKEIREKLVSLIKSI